MSEPLPESRAERREREARAQQDRAIRTIRAVMSGSDLADETLELANEFTDARTAKLAAWLRRAQ